jgi:hypothetical protein
VEKILEKIKYDPDFRSDLEELRRRLVFSDECEKKANPFNVIMLYRVNKNAKELDKVSRRVADRIRAKYHLDREEMMAVFNVLFDANR